ncbi:MAG: hypothetical protein NT067_04125 [Candidatus Diapherotrites archaeon]|nr:hypothetical protein [Candidatus Diapherotrites archaeon]
MGLKKTSVAKRAVGAVKHRWRKRQARLDREARAKIERMQFLGREEVGQKISLLLKKLKDDRALDFQARRLNQLASELANHKVNLKAYENPEHRALWNLQPPLLANAEVNSRKAEINRIRGDFISCRAALELMLFSKSSEQYAEWRKGVPAKKAPPKLADRLLRFETMGLELDTLRELFPKNSHVEAVAWERALDAISRELFDVWQNQYLGLPEEQVLNFYFTNVNLEKIKQLRKLLGM